MRTSKENKAGQPRELKLDEVSDLILRLQGAGPGGAGAVSGRISLRSVPSDARGFTYGLNGERFRFSVFRTQLNVEPTWVDLFRELDKFEPGPRERIVADLCGLVAQFRAERMNVHDRAQEELDHLLETERVVDPATGLAFRQETRMRPGGVLEVSVEAEFGVGLAGDQVALAQAARSEDISAATPTYQGSWPTVWNLGYYEVKKPRKPRAKKQSPPPDITRPAARRFRL